MSDDGSSVELEPYETQFVPKENDENELWDVIAIVAERPQQFKVKWKGIDPATRKPWKDSWVSKEDCTDDLIREWKVKQAKKKAGKSGTTKACASTTSSRTSKGAASPAIVKTRRTRQSAAKASTSSTTSRPVSIASGSRSNPRVLSPSPRKRRRTSTNEQVKLNAADPSRPLKKRKIDVEVIRPTSPELQSDRDVVTRKGVGKRSAIGSGDNEDRRHTRDRSTVLNGGGISFKAAGKRKMDPAELEESSDEDAWSPVVPIKVGPPRGAKRRRDGESKGTRHARSTSADRQTLRGHDLPRAQIGDGVRPIPHSKDGGSPRQKDTASSHPVRRPIKLPSRDFGAHNGLVGSPRSVRGVHSETNDSDSDDGHPRTSRLRKDIVVAKAQSPPQSPRSRQFLMQEEEENTQEAAGLVPDEVHAPPDPLHVTETHQADKQNGFGVGPSKLVVRRTRPQRPQANDTFSRDGIVPETQTTGAPDVLDEPLYDPTQHDLNPADPPSTPVRPAQPGPVGRRAPGSASSVVSKMKNKSRNKGKGLRPIRCLTPPDFRPYLQSSQFDDIEDFSSPEKDNRRKGRAAGPLTQDTIEEAEFSQDFDQFVDWDGGAQHEQPSASLPSNGPELSLGPELAPPDHDGGQRRKSDLLLSKRPERPVPQPLLSPTIPLLSEPPHTSTTQRADADSQSLYHPVLNGQIAELTAALEDREEKLSQLEGQIEELQERIVDLERESMKDHSAFETELKALRETSDEKSDQISLLESQLVELQLQLTQLTDSDNFESQIRQLNESLEDRDEQVSQLEAALVELQTEIETLQAANEKLTETMQQHGPRESENESADAPQAAGQRLVSLEEELVSTREQLSELARARDEAVSRANLLETASREWERRLKDAEDDRDLYRKVYSEASTHAQRLAQENTGLEERAQRAEGQVQEGLAMVRGTFTQQVKTLQAEVEKWQGLCKVLTDRDARTNDEIRSRAAQEPGLREENARLRVEAQIAHREAEELRTLVERLSSNRRKATDSEDDDDEEFVPDPDESASSRSSSASSPDPGKDASRAASSPEVHSHSSDDGLYYLCEYASGPHGCNAWFLSALDVIEHANEAHYKDAAL
ncbi:hypothetical protein C8Q74DRAFT_1364713 [Fomes fomentarius]|nr:hypothetical protein C8Q74DRAFT_1364713 [Fomes fomentarius]